MGSLSMAQFTGSFFSEKLNRNISLTAIIPTETELARVSGEKKKEHQAPRRTVYLLHGWEGSHSDWITMSRVYELARIHNVAFIMPSGQNSFYLDDPNGDAFGEFIGEELVEESRKLFPLSTNREDTWIAGLSMGGYGALRNGFKYADTFSKVAALSSRILSKQEAPKKEKLPDTVINKRLSAIIKSDTLANLDEENDPYELILKRKKEQDIFIACGLEDYLYEENKAFHKFLTKEKIKHEYYESPGAHDWDFWNESIEIAVKWMVEEK